MRKLLALIVVSVFIALGYLTQSYFLAERGDLRHNSETATQIEYPDVHVESQPQVSQTVEPLSVDNQNYTFLDLSLEDCIAYALANAKINDRFLGRVN